MPGSEAPRTKRSPSVRPTWYQMPGMLGGRCGSPAISGEPVARALAGDRPVVGAARLGGQPDRAPHRVDLLGQAEPVADQASWVTIGLSAG
jgi:hypothetical protein